nr:PVC-type heme-binding CxxCH protein [Verrucomicrobiae bacterium]
MNTRLFFLTARLAVTLLATAVCLARAQQPPATTPPPTPKLELRDGDRVVLIGDTLVEREGNYGYIETRLTARFHTNNFIFRNLGWSADTPEGQSRASFDWSKSPDDWFKLLMAQVAAVKPTVAIIGYGMANSFDGDAGLPRFKAGLTRLIDAIQALDPQQKVRFVLLSPIRHENVGAPLPDGAAHNAQLAKYTQAIEEIAKQRDIPFVNLFGILEKPPRAPEPKFVTVNGIHPAEYGYWRVAEAIDNGLGFLPANWQIGIKENGDLIATFGTSVTNITRRADYARVTALDEQLLNPDPPGYLGRWPAITPPSVFFAVKLDKGQYDLKIDGKVYDRGFSDDYSARGRKLIDGPQFDQAEKLRQAIVEKNRLFFYRWRPQNETYLFGFRKQEQGRNAREIPMFDPLITAAEVKINELKKPVPHTYELVKVAEEGNTDQLAFNTEQKLRALAERTRRYDTHVSEPVPALTPQPPPDFDVAPGFEIKLFAENPQLAKPIQMNFDPQGRLWIASSAVYPQIQPGQVANDKILVLEDTNGDGVADKSTVFADGLLTPTGVEPGDGGVYVGQSTELLHFRDTDGDGKADEKRVVLSGFGTEDTHHILHTLRWGHDGQLYMNQSIYIHTHTETPHGVERLNSGGLWHLRPSTMELGIYLKGFCNPWGHDFDEFGQSFVTDGAGFQGINYGVQGATYFTYAAMRRELPSISPGNYPKFCGLEIVASEQFPPDWQGNVITCDFRAHRVVRFGLNEQGSTYLASELPDLVRSTNVTFRPIDVKLGPDGALYIADWSNPIIQHGEVDFRDPRRDHEHGRIWRVTAKDRSLVKPEDLTQLTNDQLLNLLLSPNAFQRKQAGRVLTERGSKVVPDLMAWQGTQTTEKGQLQALWLHQA